MNAITELDDRESIHLIDCDAVLGEDEAVIEQVSRAAGVYAWYHKFSPPPPEATSGADFLRYLIRLLELPHALPREAPLKPLWQVHLHSSRNLTKAKEEALGRLCEVPQFRAFLAQTLSQHCVLLQQPLYIGKAGCLQERITQHLRGQTLLRKRLLKAGIDIRRSVLLYITTPALAVELQDDQELVVEDLLSRLFLPSFTQRYG